MTLKDQIIQRIVQGANTVWTPVDFLDLGNRDAIDKTLQRLVNSQSLRRIDRGLYDKPPINVLTAQANAPDYQKVIEAVSRRDQISILIDGMTCANDLGLTNAVPGQVLIHTDGRLRPIKLDKLVIKFKLTAPSKLFWAGRPGMRIVQSLYWLHDTLNDDNNIQQDTIKAKLTDLLQTSNQKHEICQDLKAGLYTLPTWMQKWLQKLLVTFDHK
jgi:hypothetical protein